LAETTLWQIEQPEIPPETATRELAQKSVFALIVHSRSSFSCTMRLASVLLLAACLAIGFQALPTASGIAVFLDDRLPTSHLMSAINLAQSEIDPNITVTHYYVNANFSANKALADSLAATTHFALDATKGTFMSFHLEAAKVFLPL
jgi:hypothetical protein